MASQEGHLEVVEALLAKGAKIDVQTDIGATALILASYRGNAEIVAALLAKGANTELRIEDGGTALELAKNASIKSMLRAAKKP